MLPISQRARITLRGSVSRAAPAAIDSVYRSIHSRGFFGITRAAEDSPNGTYVTKYRITRPSKDGVDWDDFLVSLPDKDDLAKTSKDVPLFVKYLKIVTDKEGRGEHFKAFVIRVKDGLQVESDVYITTEELLAVMWKNGYADTERTSIQYTFPSDYKFHYPELSALFNLSEEDTYKFCMRTRMEKSHIGQLETAKVKRAGWVRDHWLIFGSGAFIFKTFPFFNYYFVLKGFGTAMWTWTLYTTLNRWWSGSIAKHEYMAKQKVAADVMEGEERIMDAMKRFANDSKCLDQLCSFKTEMETAMSGYRKALVEVEKNALVAKMQKQLQAILAFEDSTNARLQESIIKEVAAEFKAKFDAKLESDALASALDSLEGKSDVSRDPVTSHFLASMKNIDLSGKAKPNKTGSVSERLAHVQEEQESEFAKTFYVTEEEMLKVKSANTEDELVVLMKSLYAKVGYHVPASFILDEDVPLAKAHGDATGDKYVSEASAAAQNLQASVRKAQLDSFQAGLA